ncbi:hypothetical protein BS78_09G224500 [Paspalum vaginatum]|nr:hypothetical protein BS78_09G224500 [Paspalum vaginatum]
MRCASAASAPATRCAGLASEPQPRVWNSPRAKAQLRPDPLDRVRRWSPVRGRGSRRTGTRGNRWGAADAEAEPACEGAVAAGPAGQSRGGAPGCGRVDRG